MPDVLTPLEICGGYLGNTETIVSVLLCIGNDGIVFLDLLI